MSTRLRSLLCSRIIGSVLATAPLAACGDDGGSDPVASTASMTLTSSESGDESSTGAAAESSSDGTPGTTSGTTTDAADSTSDTAAPTTGGAVEDPVYPRPVGMMCDGGQAPLTLPGGSVCAPFCTGEADACPAGGSGDATPSCTPFEEPGGSGMACRDSSTCPGDEACGFEGTCVTVAFWACRLLCDGGETCPDGMTCTAIGSCGYP
ncbi:MAG: hypothetical protein AAF721_04575 [Myxococcota bacterium]